MLVDGIEARRKTARDTNLTFIITEFETQAVSSFKHLCILYPKLFVGALGVPWHPSASYISIKPQVGVYLSPIASITY